MNAPDIVMSSLKRVLRFKQHGPARMPRGFGIPTAVARNILLRGLA